MVRADEFLVWVGVYREPHLEEGFHEECAIHTWMQLCLTRYQHGTLLPVLCRTEMASIRPLTRRKVEP